MTATSAPSLTERPQWHALLRHWRQIEPQHLRELFASDRERGERFTAEAAGLYFDYSKNRIDDETLRLLIELAEACGVRAQTEAMFNGEKINVTEQRPVLHVALRAPRSERILVDGRDVVPGVRAVLDRMSGFTDRVRNGDWKGHTWQADSQRRQYRHRRLGPRASDGV